MNTRKIKRIFAMALAIITLSGTMLFSVSAIEPIVPRDGERTYLIYSYMRNYDAACYYNDILNGQVFMSEIDGETWLTTNMISDDFKLNLSYDEITQKPYFIINYTYPQNEDYSTNANWVTYLDKSGYVTESIRVDKTNSKAFSSYYYDMGFTIHETEFWEKFDPDSHFIVESIFKVNYCKESGEKYTECEYIEHYTYVFDENGNPVEIHRTDDNYPDYYDDVYIEYDEKGYITKICEKNSKSQFDTIEHTYTNEYDNNGRLIGRIEHYYYIDGVEHHSLLDVECVYNQYQYNENGQLVTYSSDYDKVYPTKIEYEYDNNGNLIKATGTYYDKIAAIANYKYDEDGKPVEIMVTHYSSGEETSTEVYNYYGWAKLSDVFDEVSTEPTDPTTPEDPTDPSQPTEPKPERESFGERVREFFRRIIDWLKNLFKIQTAIQ